MTIEDLKKLVHASSAKPFTLHVADGRAITIPHSDHIAFPQSKKERVIFIYGEGDNPFNWVDILMITGVSGIGQPAQTESAGETE